MTGSIDEVVKSKKMFLERTARGVMCALNLANVATFSAVPMLATAALYDMVLQPQSEREMTARYIAGTLVQYVTWAASIDIMYTIRKKTGNKHEK